MHHLIYISAATTLFDRSQLREILEKSRHRNEEKGITGVLVYSEGSFLQAIEGEEEIVKSLYKRIASDPMHHNIQVLFDEPVTKRDFGEWTMAFYDVSESARISEGFNNLMNQPDRIALAELYPSKVRAFLRQLVR